MTGNERLQAHGEAEERKGTVKRQAGQTEAEIDDVKKAVKAQVHEATNSDKRT